MRNEAGFTLVELLAALFAGGLLLALLSAMTGTFGRELSHSTHDDGFKEIAAAAPLLERLLAGAEAEPGSTQAVEADARHLTTFVDPPLSRRGSGLLRFELTVLRRTDGTALDLTLTPTNGGAADRRTLVHGLRDIAIGIEQSDRPQSGRLPQLITLSFTTRTRDTWELAVEPKLTGTGRCRFDPISMACRS